MAHLNSYPKLEAKISRWAQEQTAVQAILRIGSRARQLRPADDWSDLDLILLVSEPEPYASDSAWLTAVGEPLVPVLMRYDNGFEWLVVFADGLKADFYFIEAESDLTAVIARPPFPHVLRRGADVLYIRPGLTLDLPPAEQEPAAQPTAVSFGHEVHAMLLSAFKTSKYIHRSDLWRAHLLLDTDMRTRLLTMIEWHARALFGPDRDTWYKGRYLDEWADPRVLAALPNTYGRFTPEETWRALFAMLILYRWLAEETAVKNQFPFPQTAADQILAWIQEIYTATPATPAPVDD